LGYATTSPPHSIRIVAVIGLAHGGGCEITETAPLAIASERAEFCKAEINLGFAPPFGGSQRLPRLIGRKRALRMILTAEPITASEACSLGLINDVVPHDNLIKEAFDLSPGSPWQNGYAELETCEQRLDALFAAIINGNKIRAKLIFPLDNAGAAPKCRTGSALGRVGPTPPLRTAHTTPASLGA
jgi:enoyl-CoA hydratase/carnithine racemase